MQNTHEGPGPDAARLVALHDAVLDIVAVINRPERDELLIREAGIRLERALFPLMVLVDRYGPIGVVDLAGRVGRDHSTVSRQVTRLVELGLVQRQPGVEDRRQRELRPTSAGQAMARKIDAARDRLVRGALAQWSTGQVDVFVDALRRFADALAEQSRDGEGRI